MVQKLGVTKHKKRIIFAAIYFFFTFFKNIISYILGIPIPKAIHIRNRLNLLNEKSYLYLKKNNFYSNQKIKVWGH